MIGTRVRCDIPDGSHPEFLLPVLKSLMQKALEEAGFCGWLAADDASFSFTDPDEDCIIIHLKFVPPKSKTEEPERAGAK